MGGLFHNLRHPLRCYAVCAVPRCGSNLLTDGLHATRRAGRPKQFFLRKSEPEYAAAHKLDLSPGFAAYVRDIVRLTTTSNEVFGFKLMSWYLDEFLGRLRDTGEFGGPEASDLELLRNAFPRLLFVHVARRALTWDTYGTLGLVVGATYPADVAVVRQIAPRVPILLPGVGAQAGDLERSVQAGVDADSAGAIVNASRTILYASARGDWQAAARAEAEKLRAAINTARAGAATPRR